MYIPHISICCVISAFSMLTCALLAVSSWWMVRNCGISSSSLPSGPVTVTVRFATLRYVVTSFLTLGSLMASSTVGGIDIGVLPSFEGRLEVLENWRRGDAVV